MDSHPNTYVAALDQGTTSTRFIIYDSEPKAVAYHQVEFTQIQPHPGWVEHDPMEILQTVYHCMKEAIANAQSAGHDVEGKIKAVGITNQRETTVVWSKSTGKPFHNAIVWMDVRTSELCNRLESELPGGREHFRKVTGLPISTYFSALKLVWLLENVAGLKEAAQEGEALFGTIDSWLIWNLTGKDGSSQSSIASSEHPWETNVVDGVHVTDCTNAARTMLLDLATLSWHVPTLEALKIPESMLPTIISNAEILGSISRIWPLAGVPLAGCLGDQHAAILGQRCRSGEAKSTYGTGCFILLNTGERICSSHHGLLSTVAFKLGTDAVVNYALEGSIAIAGAAVQWLRDSVGLIKKSSEVEQLADEVDDTGGLYFVPAFSGLFAPRWREDARGVMVGISRFTTSAHIARATLESICFQVREVITAMHLDAASEGVSDSFVLRVDGGASSNNLLMQMQADILGYAVVRPSDVETTALGAAMAAGIAAGLWTAESVFAGPASPSSDNENERKFLPKTESVERDKRFASWCKAVERSYDLADLIP